VNDFTANDTDAARALWASIDDPTALAVLDFLVDHTDERFKAAAIQQQLNLSAHRQVELAMYYLGRRCAALGKKRPWNEAQVGYLLPSELADLLGEVRPERVVG
jgi:hypothetical protein